MKFKKCKVTVCVEVAPGQGNRKVVEWRRLKLKTDVFREVRANKLKGQQGLS